MMYRKGFRAAVLALFISISVPAFAQPVLTVSGQNQPNSAQQYEFELTELETLGETTITTKVITLQGEHQVTGVLVRDLISKLGLKGNVIHAMALDGYIVEIPFEDFQKYDVVIATKIDGKLLSVRDKGPTWVIYPVSQHPELDDATFEAKSIWQVKSLKVE